MRQRNSTNLLRTRCNKTLTSVPRTDGVPRPARRMYGFTLVEILIVVVILGILAVIVMGRFTDSAVNSAQNTFISNTKSFATAAMLYHEKTGAFLEDSSSGDMPADFDDYVNPTMWTNGTPIGGVWDAELDSYGVKSAIGVHFDGTGDTQDDDFMTTIDSRFDDGDLLTGAFRKLADERFYYVLSDN